MKNKIGAILIIITITACTNNKPLILNEGEILNELHQENIGKIAFMEEFIPFNKFNKSHFIKNITYSSTSELNLHFFLDKTLTHSLHKLEPSLTVRELCDKGNFQITFYVDEKKIYKYNLQTGAGSCEYKNAQTVYGIPLAGKEEIDHWGRFLWMKFMKRDGGEKLLSSGTHQLKIEIRPYIENESLKVGEILAEGNVNFTMIEDEIEESKLVIQKIQAIDSWEVSKEHYNRNKIRELNKKIAQTYYKDITSIVVIKNGKLLIEEYFNGANRNTKHDTRSVGKSLASTLLGIAIKDGHIANENMTLNQFYNLKLYDNYSSIKENIQLKDLLTMTSALDGSDMNPESIGNEENMYPTSDWVKFTLDLPIDHQKKNGKQWDYFTAGAVLIGDILNKSVPKGLEKYADTKLFKPLGITDYKWQFTPTKVPNTAGGFQMNSLNNAKYGQLYLNKGIVNKQIILPEQWVRATFYHHAQIPNSENENYGYLFWNKTFIIDDKPYQGYYASGNGGNKIMVIEDVGIVIVITATAYGQPYMHFQANEMIEQYIIPAVLDEK